MEGLAPEALCGTLEVWENRATRSGPKVPLNVVVLRAFSSTPAEDAVFFLAGGPGQAATEVAGAVLPSLARLRPQRDLVFVDQRGTGKSNPLDCLTLDEQAPLTELFNPKMPVDKLRRCLSAYQAEGIDPRLYTTSIAMDDLDEVRQALGYPRINLVGGSYGTRAALVYLRQYGAHVRTAVLDGVAPTDMRLPLPFPRSAQRAFELLAKHCEETAACAQAFPSLAPRFEALLRTLAERPEGSPLRLQLAHPLTGALEEVEVTRDGVAQAVLSVLYSSDLSSLLPLALHRAMAAPAPPSGAPSSDGEGSERRGTAEGTSTKRRGGRNPQDGRSAGRASDERPASEPPESHAAVGDLSSLLALAYTAGFRTQETVSQGMFFSVVCAEDVGNVTEAEVQAAAAGSFLGAAYLRSIIDVCRFWPRGSVPKGYNQPVASDVPVLLLSGEVDPVTPPSSAEAAAKSLSSSRHLVVPGSGHNTLASPCVAKAAVRFIEEGRFDAMDTSCLAHARRFPAFVHFAGPPP